MKKKFFITIIFLLTGCSFCANIKFRKNLPEGKIIWEKTYDWNHGLDTIYDVKIDTSNNIFIAGSKALFENEKYKSFESLIKLDINGKEDIGFNQNFETNKISGVILEIQFDLNDIIYSIGYGSNLLRKDSNSDWCFRKFDKLGNEDITFLKIFDFTLENQNEFFSNDTLYSIIIDNENNIYISGNSENNKLSTMGNYSYSWVIKKFNINGIEYINNWNKILDKKSYYFISNSIVDNKNNIYISGSGINFINNNSKRDWLIKKFNSNGVEDTVSWNKEFDGNGSFDEVKTIAIDSKGNIYVAGYGTNIVSEHSNKDWWIKKFDSNGVEDTINWDKKIDGNGGNDVINAIAVDEKDNLYVVGYGSNIVEEHSNEDWWIKKFDANGIEDTVNWDIKIDHNNSGDIPNAIAIDGNGDIYVGGSGWQLVDKYSAEDLEILSDPSSPVELRIESAKKSSREDMWLIKFSGGKK